MALDLAGQRTTRVARVWLDVAWWVTVSLSVIVALVFMLSPLMARSGNISTWVEVVVATPGDADPAYQPLPPPSDWQVQELVLTERTRSPIRDLELRGISVRTFFAVNWVFLPFLAALLFGISLVRALLHDVSDGKVFTSKNAGRLARFGWVAIALGLAGPLFQHWRSWIVVERIGATTVELAAPPLEWDPALPLFFGLLLLLLASVWRYGAELQQDRDLTV